MPGYADLDAAKAILQLGELDAAEAEAAAARLAALDTALSMIFEEKVGRTWSDTPPDETVRVVTATLGPQRWPSPVLTLPPPGITSLASVVVGPTWDGDDWSGGEAVPPEAVLPIWQAEDGAYLGLLLGISWPWSGGTWYGSSWSGVVLVEAIWADRAGAVPADVVEAVTFLVAEEYKTERQSPEGLTGPDGLAIRTRNPWKFERVRAVIDAHRVPDRVVV